MSETFISIKPPENWTDIKIEDVTYPANPSPTTVYYCPEPSKTVADCDSLLVDWLAEIEERMWNLDSNVTRHLVEQEGWVDSTLSIHALDIVNIQKDLNQEVRELAKTQKQMAMTRGISDKRHEIWREEQLKHDAAIRDFAWWRNNQLPQWLPIGVAFLSLILSTFTFCYTFFH